MESEITSSLLSATPTYLGGPDLLLPLSTILRISTLTGVRAGLFSHSFQATALFRRLKHYQQNRVISRSAFVKEGIVRVVTKFRWLDMCRPPPKIHEFRGKLEAVKRGWPGLHEIMVDSPTPSERAI